MAKEYSVYAVSYTHLLLINRHDCPEAIKNP